MSHKVQESWTREDEFKEPVQALGCNGTEKGGTTEVGR